MNFQKYLESTTCLKEDTAPIVMRSIFIDAFSLAFKYFSPSDFIDYIKQYKAEHVVAYHKDIKNIVLKSSFSLNEEKYKALLNMGIHFTDQELLFIKCINYHFDFLNNYLREASAPYNGLVFDIIKNIDHNIQNVQLIEKFTNIRKIYSSITSETINYFKILITQELLKKPDTLIKSIHIYNINLSIFLNFLCLNKSKDKSIFLIDKLNSLDLKSYFEASSPQEKKHFFTFLNKTLTISNYNCVDLTTDTSTVNGQQKIFNLFKLLNESIGLNKSIEILYALSTTFSPKQIYLDKDSFMLYVLNAFKPKTKKDFSLSDMVRAKIEQNILAQQVKFKTNAKPIKI